MGIHSSETEGSRRKKRKESEKTLRDMEMEREDRRQMFIACWAFPSSVGMFSDELQRG